MSNSNREGRAWAAGLFEGEGSVGIYQKKSGGFRFTPSCTLSMTDRGPVKQFATIMNVGSVNISPVPSGKTMYRWKVGSWENVHRVFFLLQPWLHKRRTEKFLEVLRQQPAILLKGGNQNKVKTHCARGHSYTEANTYKYRGHRHCRKCQRENQQKYKEKNNG